MNWAQEKIPHLKSEGEFIKVDLQIFFTHFTSEKRLAILPGLIKLKFQC